LFGAPGWIIASLRARFYSKSRSLGLGIGFADRKTSNVRSNPVAEDQTKRPSLAWVFLFGAPGWIRTSDLRLRSPLLYPAELPGQAPTHDSNGAGAGNRTPISSLENLHTNRCTTPASDRLTLISIPEVGYTTSMQTLTLITGNAHKLKEWRRMFPADIALENRAIDLDEIQSFDSEVIIRHKVRQAYDIVKGPVIVEDVSGGLDKLNGLPGPFVKFFNERLGQDALWQLGGEGAGATVSCTIGYYDGVREIIVTDTEHGTVVAKRGEGFGFDVIFVLDGQTKTYAEMTPDEKDAISHRRKAIDKLLQQL
jgi:inosine triphosphate pyrophosphatase